MKRIGLMAVDRLLYLLHLWVMIFCVTGWIFPATRVANLILIILIAISWFGLGRFQGYGYCLITDMQWKVREILGNKPQTDSFVKYLFDKITKRDLDLDRVNLVTQIAFYVSAIASIFFNVTG